MKRLPSPPTLMQPKPVVMRWLWWSIEKQRSWPCSFGEIQGPERASMCQSWAPTSMPMLMPSPVL